MRKFFASLIFCFFLLNILPTYASYCASSRPDIQEYITRLVKKYDFDRDKLEQLFCSVTLNEEVMTKIAKPYEAKPWYQYRNFFLTPERINKGVDYWTKYEQTLAQAEKKYGVPASIIVAIIGVETKYGENKGNFAVFNTLVNLAFNHGRRADFFRSELTQYLLLTRENNLKPLLLKGSYAGALGLPQFMPSSYRHFAVDFNNKGYADLFENNEDAIASVGNYLKKYGWKTGTPVAIAATVNGNPKELVSKITFKPHLTEAKLLKHGITPVEPLYSKKVCVIALEGDNGREHWLGLQNFYVISRYNSSALYVMAVNLLAQKIREQKYNKKVQQKSKIAFIEKPEILFMDDSEEPENNNEEL